MSIGIGGIVSLGGGTSSGGGSGSGIQSINSQTGPTILLTGSNGITVSAGGNVINFNAAALSGIIPATSGVESVNGDSGPHIRLIGVNGLSVTPLGNGNILLDPASLSGLIGQGTLTEINSEVGPAIQISGINGIVVTQPRTNFILIDAASISGVGGNGSGDNACYSTTFTDVVDQTFTHSLGTKSIIVQVQDSNNEFILPDAVIATDINNVRVKFNTPTTGLLVVLSCATTISVSGVTKYAAAYLNVSSGLFSHSLGTRDVVVNCWDDSGPPRKIMPDEVILDTLDALSLVFNRPQTGRVVIMG